MKPLILALTILSTPTAFADISARLDTMTTMESQKQYAAAFLEGQRALLEVRRAFNTNAIDTEVALTMRKIIDERIVARYRNSSATRSDAVEGGISGCFDSFAIDIHGLCFNFGGSRVKRENSHLEAWDVSQFVTRNPEQIDGFNKKLEASYRKLSARLTRFVLDHKDELVMEKAIATKTLEMAYRASMNGEAISLESVAAVTQQGLHLNLLGTQNVKVCTRINYANRRSEDTTHVSQKVGKAMGQGLIGKILRMVGLRVGEDIPNNDQTDSFVTTQIAHSETSCQTNIRTVQPELSDNDISIDLNLLDQRLLSWGNAAYLAASVAPSQNSSPNWGSPYNQN